MGDKVRSGLNGPARMMFGEICCDVWFVFWCEVRYDMVELRVIWYSNFVDTSLYVNSNSIKPWFLYKEDVGVVSARVEKGVSDCVRFVDVLRQESNVAIRYGGVGRMRGGCM